MCLCWCVYYQRGLQDKVLHQNALVPRQAHMLLPQVTNTETLKTHWLILTGPVNTRLFTLTNTHKKRQQQLKKKKKLTSFQHFIHHYFIGINYLAMGIWQTDDCVCVVFPDHPPKILHGAAKWRLTHDELSAVMVSLRKHGRRQASRGRVHSRAETEA